MPTTNKIKVVYILGSGRSGTTVLNRILGQIDGFFSIGEIRQVWDRHIIENRLCGCDAKFRDCPFWTKVFNRAFGGFDTVDAAKMIREHDAHVRTRHIPSLYLPNNDRKKRERLGYYLENTEKLYHAVAAETGSKVLVDSSKLPTYLHTLSLIPSIDLHIVHLIRDPRAVAYSWQKANKLQPDGGSDKETMRRLSPARTSALWVTWNLAGDMLWRKGSAPYLRMRYEQFMEQPRTHTEALLKFLDEDRSLSAFTSEREICMTPDHTVAGNPNRFMTGNVELRPDDAWRPRIKKWHKWTVTGLTWPLLKRYGIL